MVRTYVVTPHGGRRAHPDITSALRAAAQRGGAARIEIARGYYEETLVVRGDVELTAQEPGSVLVGPPRGAVLDALGSVVVRGLVLVGRDSDVVGCRGGTLTLDRVEVRAHGGVCVNAGRGASVTLTDSWFRYGRTLFAGSSGHVERCRFTDAADNAVAVIEGARVSVQDSRIEGSRIHGLRVSDAWARLTRCQITGTEQAAVCADTRAELTMAYCAVTAVHGEAIVFNGQSRGSVHGTRVTDAEHGIAVATGADPVVRDCVFDSCRDSGINVNASGRGTFENCEVLNAGTIAVFSTKGGAPEIRGCRIAGGNVGVAVTEKGRGRFTQLHVTDLTAPALRVWHEGRAVFEQVRVERCPSALEVKGNGGTTAELTDAQLFDFDMAAVDVTGQSRVTLNRVSAQRGLLAFGAGEEALLRLHDCQAGEVTTGGALAFGKARLVARNLTVTGSKAFGLCGTHSAYVDVADSSFEDCAAAGVTFDESGSGRLVDCSVTGTKGAGVQHNGRVVLVSINTSLPVVQRTATPPPTTVNNFHGPVFNAAVQGAQLAWNNNAVNQQQTDQNGAGT